MCALVQHLLVNEPCALTKKKPSLVRAVPIRETAQVEVARLDGQRTHFVFNSFALAEDCSFWCQDDEDDDDDDDGDDHDDDDDGNESDRDKSISSGMGSGYGDGS